MIIGTTPTHKFELPFSTTFVDAIDIEYWQDGNLLLTKDKSHVELDGNSAKLKLTVEETRLFNCDSCGEYRIFVATTGGDRLACPKTPFGVCE